MSTIYTDLSREAETSEFMQPGEAKQVGAGAYGGMNPAEVTMLIEHAAKGDSASSARLMEVVYDQLRALAGSYTGGRQANHTLHATALVHEAFVKLVQSPSTRYNDRAHFFAIAATAMRQILSDHARNKRALKRGGAGQNVGDPASGHTMAFGVAGGQAQEFDAVALDDCLRELERENPRAYRVVELRFFGGLEVDDVANLLGVSRSTAEADWRAARAWLGIRLRP